MKRAALSLAALLLMMSPAAHAQQFEPKPLEPGQTLLSLSATEQMNVQQDLLQASLRIEIDAKNPKEIQDKINKAMQDALTAAKGVAEVKASTGQYYVYSYDPNPAPSSISTKDAKGRIQWKGSQTIDLSSKDSAKLLELAGKIQEMGFVMGGLNYTLSPELSESYKDTLMTAALTKIQARAALAAKALGKKGVELVEVNVDNQGMVQPMPMMYKMARAEMASADASMAPPVAQAGEQAVSLMVTARVLLKP